MRAANKRYINYVTVDVILIPLAKPRTSTINVNLGLHTLSLYSASTMPINLSGISYKIELLNNTGDAVGNSRPSGSRPMPDAIVTIDHKYRATRT